MKKIVFINNTWLFVAVLLACFVFSAGVRYQQFETWKQTPAAYFVGERPMMTTLDAPFWLRWAREFNEGTFGQNGALGEYPRNTETFRDRPFLKNLETHQKFLLLHPTLLNPLHLELRKSNTVTFRYSVF